MDERAKSEFNAALEYLGRLIELKQNAAVASMNLDAHAWLQSLAAIVRWVSHHMKENEIIEAQNYMVEIQQLILRTGSKTRGIPSQIPSHLYYKLHNFEIWLNTIIKDAGLYARMQDDASHALR